MAATSVARAPDALRPLRLQQRRRGWANVGGRSALGLGGRVPELPPVAAGGEQAGRGSPFRLAGGTLPAAAALHVVRSVGEGEGLVKLKPDLLAHPRVWRRRRQLAAAAGGWAPLGSRCFQPLYLQVPRYPRAPSWEPGQCRPLRVIELFQWRGSCCCALPIPDYGSRYVRLPPRQTRPGGSPLGSIRLVQPGSTLRWLEMLV